MGEVKTLEELVAAVQGLRGQGKTLVQCHGVFDLLHPGHIRHLQAAKRLGDALVVTVTPDRFVNKGPNRPAFPEVLRAESLAALGCVDLVAVNRWPTAVEAIALIRPDVYAKGRDYSDPSEDETGAIREEEEAVRAVGGRMHLTEEPAFSSSHLLNTHFGVCPQEARPFLRGFREAHRVEDIVARLKALSSMTALVVGDAIIDQYWYVEGLGKSPKDNIITTRHLGEESFAGGALATANHLAGLCGTVHLVTCLGRDGHEAFIRSHLRPNVTPHILHHGGPTTVKRRLVDPAFLTKLIEVAWLDETAPAPVRQELRGHLEETLRGDKAGDYALVVAADFGHGLIDRQIAELLSGFPQFLAVNAQANSANMGFNLITKYPGADYVCLDEPELRLACRDRHGRLEDLVSRMMDELRCQRLAVTLGHRGSMAYSPEGGFTRIPALSDRVVDRMGAGDAYLAVTAPCVAAGMPMEEVSFVGNAASALAVGTVGNREPVDPVALFRFIKALLA